MNEPIKDIQNRIKEVESLDELFEEIDMELYDEEFERL